MWEIHIQVQCNSNVASSKVLKFQKNEYCAEQFSQRKTEELDNSLLL